MTNEVIVDQLNEFRQSLAHLEKTFERDDKYASIRQQIENMVVDIARKNKKLTENQDTQILHLNTEIGHLKVRLEEYKTTVSAVTSDLVTI
jgi:chromosome segregation ATPase